MKKPTRLTDRARFAAQRLRFAKSAPVRTADPVTALQRKVSREQARQILRFSRGRRALISERDIDHYLFIRGFNIARALNRRLQDLVAAGVRLTPEIEHDVHCQVYLDVPLALN